MYLYQLNVNQVTDNIMLEKKFGHRRFGYNWFGDTRNNKLLMVEFASSDKSQRALKMPDDQLYTYIDASSPFESNNAFLYQHLKERDQFYDPYNTRPIYRYTVSNSRICFQQDYFYHQRDGTYYTYKHGKFTSHDLISNFRAGDLLYGTERERLKVREVIKHRRAGSLTFVTADEIHRVGSFNEEPFFADFDGEYDTYIQCYKQHLGKSNPTLYHPSSAQSKVTKTGVKVSKADAQIRRSCKALMVFMMCKRNAQIHFIMDNIREDNQFTDVERRHVKKYRLYSNANFKAYTDGKEVEWLWKGT